MAYARLHSDAGPRAVSFSLAQAAGLVVVVFAAAIAVIPLSPRLLPESLPVNLRADQADMSVITDRLPSTIGAKPGHESVSVASQDLDVRDLSSAQDSVTVVGSGGDALKTTNGGTLEVELNYDSAHVIGVVSSTNDPAGLNLKRVVSGDPIGGAMPANFRTYPFGGTAGVTDRIFQASTSGDAYSYGAVQSFRAIRSRVGQGDLVRFSARYDAGVHGVESGVGALDIGNELSFGYKDTHFGIWRRYGGLPEVQELEITAAGTDPETITLNLGGTEFIIPEADYEGSTEILARAIDIYFKRTNPSSGWNVESYGSTVLFSGTSARDLPLSTFASTGAAEGNFTLVRDGTPKNDVFTPTTQWSSLYNVPDGFDPARGNNYQIAYDSEYGRAKFYVMTSSGYMLVHTIDRFNMDSNPLVTSQGMHIGLYAYRTTPGDVISVYARGLAAFSPTFTPTRNPRVLENEIQGATTEERLILAVRTKRIVNGYTNQAEVVPLRLSASNDHNRGAIFFVRTNAQFICGTGGSLTTSTEEIYQDPGTNRITLVATPHTDDDCVHQEGTGRLLSAVAVPRLNSQQVVFDSIRVPPTLPIAVSVRMLSGTSDPDDMSAALVFYEDI